MKVSKYTFLIEACENLYAYNTLSNSLIQINDKDVYLQIKKIQEKNLNLVKENYDPEFYDILSKHKIITENDEDDFLIFKSIIMAQRQHDSSMHLTIAPTMDCCFNCHYCFEKEKAKTYMTHETMDAIIKYVMSLDKLESLSLTWFGGEPLMAIKQIEEFYDKFKPQWGDREFISNIVTTGYHLDKDVIRILDKVGVDSVQITLDGNRETHNKIKNFPGSGDVFEHVLKNVELYNDISPKVNIVFRVNLTLENANEYESLQNMILERFKGRQMIAIAPAFVMDRSINGCKPQSKLFSHKQMTEYILDLMDRGISCTYKIYPENFFYECAIRNKLAIAFDPEGYAYKCWEIIGNRRHSIGRLNADGQFTDINNKMLNRQLFGADPLDDPICNKCKYLPICGGGCPIQRIENKFEDGKNNCCTYFKGYLDKFIKEYIRQRSNKGIYTTTKQ